MTEDGLKNGETTYVVSKKILYSMFLYYVLILVICMFFSVYFVLKVGTIETEKIIMYTVLSSLSICGMTCSMRYIRKLYKACIRNQIDHGSGISAEHIGFVVYFFTRPFFAFAFTLLMILSLLAGLYLVAGSLDYVMNNRFFYLCIMLSSCIGYSIGKFIDNFESYSESFVQKIVK